MSAVNHNPSPFERISASSRSLRMSLRSQPSSSSTAGSQLRSSDLLNSDPATQNSQIVLISRDPSLTLLEKITLLSVKIDTVEVYVDLVPVCPRSAQHHLSVRRLPNSHVFGKSTHKASSNTIRNCSPRASDKSDAREREERGYFFNQH